MSEDRTVPMQQPQWSRRETDSDEQETVYADQEAVTPPTMPLTDKDGWQSTQDAGFVRTTPGQGPSSPPYQPPQSPYGPDRNTIGVVHSLHPDTTTLGRVAGNAIVVQDDTVSAQHARIRRETKEGQEPVFALFDLGSRNGIFVGDKDTYKDEENRVYRHELQDGDYLLIGETTLVFKRL
jgi:hypothetical protein